MSKTINLIIFLTSITFINTGVSAETKKDCSQYSTKTLTGLSDKMRCKRGLAPRKNNFLKSLDWKKNKSKPSFDPNKSCDEYSTKNLVGLVNKIKCKRQNN
tara:strand:+ start:100 stop:402 length:303 start_codon:yes stop_codon:yes gene_type:complete